MFAPQALALVRSEREGDANLWASGIDVASFLGCQERTGHSRTRQYPAGVKDGKLRAAIVDRTRRIDPRLAHYIDGISFHQQVLAAQAAVVAWAGR